MLCHTTDENILTANFSQTTVDTFAYIFARITHVKQQNDGSHAQRLGITFDDSR